MPPSKSVTIPAASSSKPTSSKKKDKNKNNTLGAYYYDSLSKEKTENSILNQLDSGGVDVTADIDEDNTPPPPS